MATYLLTTKNRVTVPTVMTPEIPPHLSQMWRKPRPAKRLRHRPGHSYALRTSSDDYHKQRSVSYALERLSERKYSHSASGVVLLGLYMSETYRQNALRISSTRA